MHFVFPTKFCINYCFQIHLRIDDNSLCKILWGKPNALWVIWKSLIVSGSSSHIGSVLVSCLSPTEQRVKIGTGKFTSWVGVTLSWTIISSRQGKPSRVAIHHTYFCFCSVKCMFGFSGIFRCHCSFDYLINVYDLIISLQLREMLDIHLV